VYFKNQTEVYTYNNWYLVQHNFLLFDRIKKQNSVLLNLELLVFSDMVSST